MEQDELQLTEQIERCRRLANAITDEDMRQSLEELARQYERELKRAPSRPFMLRRRGSA